MRHVLGIDPGGESGKGGETGIVLMKYDDDTPLTLVDYWAIPAGVDYFRMWERNTQFVQVDTVICENFLPYKGHVDYSPLKLIGAVQYRWPDVILRSPQQRKVISDEGMKALGAYVPGGHHRDVTEAARHVVAWLVKTRKHVPTQRVVLIDN